MAAPSASYQGGLNTIARVFPAGTTGAHIVGKMPKNGKITRVRYSGQAAQSGLSAIMRIRGLNGSALSAITSSTSFAGIGGPGSRIGVEASFLPTAQGLRDAKDNQILDVLFTGTTATDLLVEVAFEPR